MAMAVPRLWHGLARNRRVLMLGKPCFFYFEGRLWCAAELGGEVYVRRMQAVSVAEHAVSRA